MTASNRLPVPRDPDHAGTPARGEAPERARDMRDLGRDGITAMVTSDRALRAREVSRPGVQQLIDADAAVERLIARARGQR